MTMKGLSQKHHGLSSTRAAIAWYAMWRRVQGKTSAYKRQYMDRGITVCDRWKDIKEFFDDMGEPHEGMTLERIDVNGSYEPSNCKWAPMSEQYQNRRNSMVWVVRGKKFTSARKAASALGVCESTVRRWCGIHSDGSPQVDGCHVVYKYTLQRLPAPTISSQIKEDKSQEGTS